jgi:hypothetical protein
MWQQQQRLLLDQAGSLYMLLQATSGVLHHQES